MAIVQTNRLTKYYYKTRDKETLRFALEFLLFWPVIECFYALFAPALPVFHTALIIDTHRHDLSV